MDVALLFEHQTIAAIDVMFFEHMACAGSHGGDGNIKYVAFPLGAGRI